MALRQVAPAFLLLLSGTLGGCSEPEIALGAWSTRSIDEFVRWGEEIRLEENEQVVNVWPVVQRDPEGGFLVADTREAQARLYDGSGRLRARFGSRGKGPAEFDGLVAALRLPSREIVLADRAGKVAVLDSSGVRVLRTYGSGLLPLYDAELLQDSLLLLVGRGSVKTGPLLHVFDPRSGRLLRHFFTVTPRGILPGSAMTAGFAEAAVHGDTIAVIHSITDTLYRFSAAGASLGKMPIPFRHFRPIRHSLPRNPTREQTHAWLSSFSLASHAFWGGGGTWLIQYQDRNGPEIRWRLLGMTHDGKRLFELRDSPQLLATEPATGRLYFVAPRSLAPNLWSVARLGPR